MVKNQPANAGTARLIPGWGRSHTPCVSTAEACVPGAYALPQETPLQREACTTVTRELPPLAATREKAHSNRYPAQPKQVNK